jgi:PA26 p53-induced protein (sestrin)
MFLLGQVMGQHRAYLSTFLRTHSMLLRGDGPLAAPVRHYLALMAASRHACAHLVDSHRLDFLAYGGDPTWLRDGLAAVPPKIRALSELNKLLAHRPWAIGPAHIEALTHSPSPANWSLSELVYAIVLMAHFHAFSSFIESCVLMETTYKKEGTSKPDSSRWRRPNSRHNSGKLWLGLISM